MKKKFYFKLNSLEILEQKAINQSIYSKGIVVKSLKQYREDISYQKWQETFSLFQVDNYFEYTNMYLNITSDNTTGYINLNTCILKNEKLKKKKSIKFYTSINTSLIESQKLVNKLIVMRRYRTWAKPIYCSIIKPIQGGFMVRLPDNFLGVVSTIQYYYAIKKVSYNNEFEYYEKTFDINEHQIIPLTSVVPMALPFEFLGFEFKLLKTNVIANALSAQKKGVKAKQYFNVKYKNLVILHFCATIKLAIITYLIALYYEELEKEEYDEIIELILQLFYLNFKFLWFNRNAINEPKIEIQQEPEELIENVNE